MPRRTLLSAEARSRLFGIPTERAEMARHYILDAADSALVRARRRAANRLGFAVQLCLLRHPGTGLGTGEHPPRRCWPSSRSSSASRRPPSPTTPPATRPAASTRPSCRPRCA
jgi:TnpA family transposase